MLTPNPITLRRQDLTGTHLALLEKRLHNARQAATANNTAAATPGIRPRQSLDAAPLSFAQERLWFLDQLYPGQAVYNVYQAVRLSGRLDLSALEYSLNEIIRRHQVFRTNFTTQNGSPVQIVAAEQALQIETINLSGPADAAREAKLRAVLQAAAARPFDLARDPMLRVLLVQLDANTHVLLLTMHHIISDGWSLGIIFRELALLYEAGVSGCPAELVELPIQYVDYAAWERESQPATEFDRNLAYWREQLKGVPVLELPADRPRPAVPTVRGAVSSTDFPLELTQALKALSQREGVTLFMTLLAGFQTLLHRYTGQDDIAVGSCVAGRQQVELEHLVGFFVNTLVFRTHLDGDPSFRELLGRTRETALGAFAHQSLPFEKLVEELQPDRHSGRNPFFQVMFVLQSATGALPQAAALEILPCEIDNGTTKFDLTLSIAETPAGLHAAVEYNRDLFDRGTIERLLGHFRTLLTAVATDAECRLSRLPVLSEAELCQILDEWSGGRTDYPRDSTIDRLFAEQAVRSPAAVAVTHAGGRLTYGELNGRANQIAHHLHRLGAPPGALIGVCLERSPDLIAALLGILKAGCAYVSLDPAYPRERLAFMLEDTRAPVLLTQAKLHPLVHAALGAAGGNGGRQPPFVVQLDSGRDIVSRESTAESPRATTPDSLAYVSYTSGSTGRPKGVCIPHRGVVRLVKGADYGAFDSGETFLQFAPVAFDASTFEIWGALLNGARLALFPADTPSLTELGQFIRDQRVTTLWLTAGLFHQMVDHQAANLRGVRQLLAGGDVLSPAHVTRALATLDRTRLINGYGPTENTTFTCCHRISGPPPPGGSVPIGRPVANTQVFILDAALQPVPVGVPGELFTGGDGLALGYLNRPDLTREKFVPHPFSARPGARLYRTGDRVRWRPDGSIEFLGRVDRQVKIRGFRIELEEIETALDQHPAVREAVVTVRANDQGEKRLVAYLSAQPGRVPLPGELRQHLRTKLPDYMLPSAFVVLDQLPLNANGKVDRDRLPVPGSAPASPGAGFTAPRNETEAQLAAIWERVLEVRPVGVHDNFFELGGHSLAGVRLFAQIEAQFGRKLPLASLFQMPTVGQLARRLDHRGPEAAEECSSLVTLQPKGTRPPMFFVHGAGGGNLWTYTNLVPHLGPDQPVHAFESRAMRGLEEFDRIEDMASHYLDELRTVQPHGPYYLGGYCFGGNVAYEMARQLSARGEPVALLALLDSAPADGFLQRIPWWRPVFLFRFAVNTAYWLQDFLSQTPDERRRFVSRKLRLWRRRAARLLAPRRDATADGIDLDEVIDVALFPEIEVRLWRIHLHALWSYRAGPYAGRVTLFRTRGQPFLCSFDPQFGWGGLAAGGVEVVNLPGAHEKIFMEPHVRTLSAALRDCLTRAQQRAAREAPELSLP